MESQNITKREILGTIYNCKKVINSGTDNIVNLFESEAQLYPGDNIEDINLIPINNLNNFAYLNNVKALLESSEIAQEMLSNPELANFFIVLNNKIDTLKKTDDFQKFDTLNEIAQKTKLFARSPINVYGFNIFDIDKILIEHNIDNVSAIAYNKTDKQFILLIKDELYIYDLNSGIFGDFNDMKLKHIDPINVKVKKDDFVNILKEYISYNIVVLYLNKDGFTFKDNLFRDVKRKNAINQNIINMQNNSIIKK